MRHDTGCSFRLRCLAAVALVIWPFGQATLRAADPPGRAGAPPPSYKRDGSVNDFAHVLTRSEVLRVRTALAGRALKGVDVVVVTLPDLGGRPIEDVSIELARRWRIGATSGHAGILVTLVPKERRSRIEVSRNLEEALTDEECRQILVASRDDFARGAYGRGLERIVDAIGEQLPRSQPFAGRAPSATARVHGPQLMPH